MDQFPGSLLLARAALLLAVLGLVPDGVQRLQEDRHWKKYITLTHCILLRTGLQCGEHLLDSLYARIKAAAATTATHEAATVEAGEAAKREP